MSASAPADKSGPRKPWSLRNRLLALLLTATAGLWALASYSVYQESRLDSQVLFDDSLRETAYLMLTMVEHEMAEHGVDYAAQLVDAAEIPATRYLRFQVWDNRGNLIYRTANTPTTELAPSTANNTIPVLTTNDDYRTFAAWNADQSLFIQMAEPLSRRAEVTRRVVWRLALFAAVCLPLTMAFIWWIVARGFAPIRWLSEDVAQRTGQHLQAVDLYNVPREVSPLIEALNRLLERIRDTLAHERRFTADAAHELRTPLAAIRAHAQVLKGARNTDEAAEAAQDIIAGVDRSTRLVEQLLALARVDKVKLQAQPPQRVDLQALAHLQLLEHQGFAHRQGVRLESQLHAAEVMGYPDQLNMLLRNLIDNAIRYTPAGERVQVSCGVRDAQVFLAVHDAGVGIPPAERQRIFERFYRITRLETANVFGSGLGLSIVQRLVEQHQARIEIVDGLDGKGVGFVVWFKAVSEAGGA